MAGFGEQSSTIQCDSLNYFQLACIPSASLGLPVVIMGHQLAASYGAGTAICSIILGNLILWLIAMGIISMVDRVHANAIDNIKSYIGKYGGMLVALILMFGLLNWYAMEINMSMSQLNNLYQFDLNWRKDIIIRFGAALGLFFALLSIGGIRLLKRITVFSLPLLFCYSFYAIITSDFSLPLKGSWTFSLPAIIASILALFPGIINIPTVFRHSRSRAHSYFALTLMIVFISFLEISTIWMHFSNISSSGLGLDVLLIALFFLLILTCCNLLNIYFASACWETIVPRFGGSKGYAIIGLVGTSVYTFFQISSPVKFMRDIINSYMGVLGIVLLMAFLVRIIVRHRPRKFEKVINLVTWLFGCIVSTVYEIGHFLQGVDALIMGVNASILFFLGVIFVEETVWALRKKFEHRKA